MVISSTTTDFLGNLAPLRISGIVGKVTIQFSYGNLIVKEVYSSIYSEVIIHDIDAIVKRLIPDATLSTGGLDLNIKTISITATDESTNSAIGQIAILPSNGTTNSYQDLAAKGTLTSRINKRYTSSNAIENIAYFGGSAVKAKIDIYYTLGGQIKVYRASMGWGVYDLRCVSISYSTLLDKLFTALIGFEEIVGYSIVTTKDGEDLDSVYYHIIQEECTTLQYINFFGVQQSLTCIGAVKHKQEFDSTSGYYGHKIKATDVNAPETITVNTGHLEAGLELEIQDLLDSPQVGIIHNGVIQDIIITSVDFEYSKPTNEIVNAAISYRYADIKPYHYEFTR